MKDTVRLVAGLAVGTVAAVAIPLAGFGTLRTLWPAYAAAEPGKTYSLATLLLRLSRCCGVIRAACRRS